MEKDDLLTIQQVADILHVDYTTVQRYIRQGLICAIALNTSNARPRKRIRQSEVARFLKAGEKYDA